jgi:FkbM family methyltransferase
MRAEVWLDELGVEVAGVLHIGAHDGREVPTYRKLGFERIVLVEPNLRRAAGLKAITGVEVLPFALGTTPGHFALYMPHNDEAASLLKPVAGWNSTQSVEVRRLETLDLAGVNVVVADVQGSEVDALSSGPLDGFELAVVEATTKARYVGGATQADVDELMVAAGFVVVERYPHRLLPKLVDTYYLRP